MADVIADDEWVPLRGGDLRKEVDLDKRIRGKCAGNLWELLQEMADLLCRLDRRLNYFIDRDKRGPEPPEACRTGCETDGMDHVE